MKIPKLFKKAAAFVMAAVTALSIMPATAFAAGDIGTIFFSHTYDSNGNAMRYNSSANIGGYTAGGTGNYKYRMFVDGENAFCIQPGVPLKTGNTLKKASSDTWNALSANQKKAVGLALLYGYQGNRNNLSGSDDEKWLATQTLVWEFVTGCREATGSYMQNIEIEKVLYDLFNRFELEDISYLNRVSRHIEHSELTENSLNDRVFYKEESLEETVSRCIEYELLHKAISKLPETQRRRLLLYFFGELSYEQIAKLEGCTKMAVKGSVDIALKKLKKLFEKF